MNSTQHIDPSAGMQARARAWLRAVNGGGAVIAGFLLVARLAAPAAEFYVTPTGNSAGDGSPAKPWDLQTALNQPRTVKPGDTIWLHGGVHRINNFPTKFASVLAGTAAKPITVRVWPGERATIDGNLSQFRGGWVNYWGLEIINSLPNRTSTRSGSWPTTWWITTSNGKLSDYCVAGVDLRAPNVKFINCIIHENIGGGFGVDSLATGSEVYGSLSYYNGWQAADRGHGHGLYLQNAGPTTTKITDSMFFANYALGTQVYGSGPNPVADDVDFEGNAFFMNGILALHHQSNFLLGTIAGVAQNDSVISNYVYDTMGSSSDVNLGYDAGTKNAIVRDNYFGTSFWLGPTTGLTLSGNTFCAGTLWLDQATYPHNTYLTAPPTTGTKVFVRPNRYEPGRANIIIYNWGQATTVNVDISNIGLTAGDTYELHNVQDFYTDTLTGTYTGPTIAIPMTNHSVAIPTYHTAPPSTFPNFGAFVIMKPSTGTPVADRPTISDLADQTINVNTFAGPLPFTVGSSQVPATSLTTVANSSNTTLVPVANIVLGGSGANRTVTIIPVANQTGQTTITIDVSDGVNETARGFQLTVTAVTPASTNTSALAIWPVAGTYTGLIIDTNTPTHASSGFIQIVLAKTGAFAGNLTLAGQKSAFKGRFDLTGTATNTVAGAGVVLDLEMDGDNGLITGTVTGNGFTSALLAELPGPSPVGTYTLLLSPADVTATNLPQGYGYATLTVSRTGCGSLCGVLNDGTKLTAKAPVSQSGQWPLYVSLYNNTGACISWIALTPATVTGVVDWFAPASTGYAAFTTTLPLDGSQYTTGPQLSGTWDVASRGGGLVSNLLTKVRLSAAGKVLGTNALTLKLRLKTGQFTGRFTPPAGGKAIPFNGLLLQVLDVGAGLFQTAAGLTGGITLEPVR